MRMFLLCDAIWQCVIMLCAVPPRIVSSERSSLVVREGDSVSLLLLCDDIWQCVILLCAVPPRLVSSESSSLVVREGDSVSLFLLCDDMYLAVCDSVVCSSSPDCDQ